MLYWGIPWRRYRLLTVAANLLQFSVLAAAGDRDTLQPLPHWRAVAQLEPGVRGVARPQPGVAEVAPREQLDRGAANDAGWAVFALHDSLRLHANPLCGGKRDRPFRHFTRVRGRSCGVRRVLSKDLRPGDIFGLRRLRADVVGDDVGVR
jgi:hypothetical protein